ncbi:HEPN domain-containing protein [Sphingomonas sp. BIUV-7]|uniref:HEPN domain-containing protein n=1 Tax=Sphingomonas natans TaxID=3063330 RepID=A0ABT8YCM0_9SPHN|nr:HEPN domain-containing protein [Sphingomonas sp. BIUV-7]MDO6416094.1 HEPN domain-containing protein [Sphingomonas sp. BIUV-7]
MRSDLDHLPKGKQRELAQVVRVLFEEFEAALRPGNQRWNKQGRILKLVLYGSYARGGWVDDPIGGYHSDYDILIVVNDERLTDFDYWSAAEDRLMREVTIAQTLGAPVNFIVHTLTDVNQQLERGRPFFVDIVNQGIALYEAEGKAFAHPRILPPEEARVEAQGYFDKWFASAGAFLASSLFLSNRGDANEAAFNLHQATERFYHCALLVLTLYSPKSHKLNFLRSHAEELASELIEAWPRNDKLSRRVFELLRQAYVNARYSPHYVISDDELRWLAERVGVLQTLVLAVCERRLALPDL